MGFIAGCFYLQKMSLFIINLWWDSEINAKCPVNMNNKKTDKNADKVKVIKKTTDTTAPVAVPKEIGGRKDGLDPTRYGDWEKNGRCIDF